MGDADYRGRFLWYELMTTDPASAQAFYKAVVGWGTQALDSPGMQYVMWTRDGAPIGGLMELPKEAREHGAPPHWMPYVGTPEIDKTFEQALALGAKTYVPPTDIPSVGRFAVLADPQGATFALYTPATPPSEQAGPPAIGDFSWHELVTTDHGAGFEFYRTLLGWEKTGEHDMGPMGLYQLFGRQGFTLGGMFNKPAEMPAPPHWMLYARVDDIQRAAAAVKSAGGQVIHGPVEVPGGDWILQGVDPQGGYFALHQRKL